MEPTIKVDFSGFLKALNRIQANLPSALEKGVEAVATAIQQEVIFNANKMFRHNGSNGITKNTKIIPAGKFARTVIVDKNYAWYLENGNNQKGEYIYPIRAKALRFYANGKIIFAKKAKTFGPTHFFSQAINTVKPKIQSIVADSLKDIIK